MISIGNLPAKDRALAKELNDLELQISQNFNIPRAVLAKSFVCLAHDWFQMDVDEEGHRLLQKAEDTFPGYFTNEFAGHRLADPQFEIIAKNLIAELSWLVMERLEARKSESIN